MLKEKEENGSMSHLLHHHESYIRNRDLEMFEHGLLDGDTFLQVNTFYSHKYLIEND